jgi:hypothetical protein
MGGVTCCAGLPPLFIKTYRSGVARMILAFIIKADFPFRSESILKTILFMSPFASCKNPEEWPLLCTVNWSVFIWRTQIWSIYSDEFQRNNCLNFLKLNTAHHCMFGPVIFRGSQIRTCHEFCYSIVKIHGKWTVFVPWIGSVFFPPFIEIFALSIIHEKRIVFFCFFIEIFALSILHEKRIVFFVFCTVN